ncbi:Early nodulin-like protein 1 [Bienertia sinuspersici]
MQIQTKLDIDITYKKSFKSYYNFMNLMIPILSFIYLLFTVTKSEEIIVGGNENRWTDGFAYVNWAKDIKFTVGDVLVFQYNKEKHDLYDVNRETFKSCNTSNGVNAVYNSGDDHVELKEAKEYWFICTFEQHCQLGMKFGINVSEAITATNSPVNSPINNSSMEHITKRFYYVIAIGILSLLITIL